MKTTFTHRKLTSLITLFFVIIGFVSLAQKKHIVEASINVFTPSELTINAGDTVEWRNIEGWHNVDGLQSTYPDNPESFGNSQGSGWVYSHIFNAEGVYNYHCDPHVGLGMKGKIIVEASANNQGHTLTINFSSMNPHVGQTLYLSLIDSETGKEVERKTEDIDASFSVQLSGLEKGHSYHVDFFADFNENGIYDTPPTDHAWRMEVNNVSDDVILDFVHNTNFTDISWEYKLTLNFMNMNPHLGQKLTFYLVDAANGSVIDYKMISEIINPDFSIESYNIVPAGSYNLDFYADHNGNGIYDAPPVDHSWQILLNSISRDTTITFTHNTNFTDISAVTPIIAPLSESPTLYPNPVSSALTLQLNDSGYEYHSIYDISGKQQKVHISTYNNVMDIKVNELKAGIYFVELLNNKDRMFLKFIKN
ncbi:plastocyanin/azurin family copper-binding protein [Saccharicrinis sp. FJH54]|uniref:plastocyanin/azurin family copper-binding protein n=1 Tax=Saccharicrinis sp. FJH54 TaxID=3344665 RepID=UPI0035D45810